MGRYIHVAELTRGLVSLTTSTTAIGTTDVHGVSFGGIWGRLKRSAGAMQLFGRLAILETHTL